MRLDRCSVVLGGDFLTTELQSASNQLWPFPSSIKDSLYDRCDEGVVLSCDMRLKKPALRLDSWRPRLPLIP